MARAGWLKLWRQMADNPLWAEKPFSRGQAWVDVLIRTNFSDTRIPNPGKLANVTLGPGEAIASLTGLEKSWGWSRNRVLRFLEYLREEKMITTKNEVAYTRISVLNWRKWQGLDEPEAPLQTEPLTEPPTELVTELGVGTSAKSVSGTSAAPRKAPNAKQLRKVSTTSGTSGKTEVGTTPRTERGCQTEPITEPIRRKQQQQEEKNKTTPAVTTSPVAPDTGTTGDPSGSVVAVPEGTAERLLKMASVRLAAPMLESIGVDPEIVPRLAASTPAVQIYHVVESAKTKTNPGGWARDAIQQGWTVPEGDAKGLSRLLDALLVEALSKETAWRKMGGALRGRDPAHQRREGESETDWMKRVQEDLRKRKGPKENRA